MKKPDYLIQVLSTKLFHYDQETRTFCAEISTLECNGYFPGPRQIWDDACDTGFYLESHKTGRKILFVLSETCVEDGFPVEWLYISADPEFEFELTIFND